ncbi:TIGR03086 family protein [Mycolicibacterium moriokaense]|uniref:TIGR03086 family protein n=1 Tax=Mycolicibacterium moriokaense TaxID=39691 RepID=A0AAD1H536_9MYCO|nr:TIGR03086 family protein [Mycolicibacterium moriokaense]
MSASVDVVASVTIDDLDRPTPCSGWNLADLLAHMIVQHNGFAAAARGHGADLAVWQPSWVADAVAADPAGAYAAAAADLLDAFDAEGVLDAPFALPEFGPDAVVPGSMAIGFHFVDYVVHGWDVARSIDVPFDLPPDVVSAVLPIALAVPDGDFRAGNGSPFARALAPRDGASDLDSVLRHLGRSPAWSAATQVL